MIGPLDDIVRVLSVDLDTVQIADVLHIGGIGAQNPGIDRQLPAVDLDS